MRTQTIDEFLDRWNMRRGAPNAAPMFSPRNAEHEAALNPSQRQLFRQLIVSFLGRFRPDRRSFHQRLGKFSDRALNDLTMSQTLEQMGVEALSRHLGVALPPHEASRALMVYQICFKPCPAPSVTAATHA